MKLGLSYVSYKDKLLGEQVAYVIDDMLNAVENGKRTIESTFYFIKNKKQSMTILKNVSNKMKKTSSIKYKKKRRDYSEKMSWKR